LCSGVRYEVTEPFQRAGYCHCPRCRKLTGGLSGVNGAVSREGFRLLAGAELLGVYEVPGDAKAAVFCTTCGSSLFRGQWPDGQMIGIRLGTLDIDPRIRPQYHIFVDSRAPWEELPEDGLPRHSERSL
jgi:hypothetical protein